MGFTVIIPASGLASRIGNIPKFLLPHRGNVTIIENILKICDSDRVTKIIISTRPEYVDLLYPKIKDNDKICLIVQINNNMNETVKGMRKLCNDDNVLMLMADTFIYDYDLVDKMLDDFENHDVSCGVWRIREEQRGKLGQCNIINDMVVDVVDKNVYCEYPYAWGCLAWKTNFWDYIDIKKSHVGYCLKPMIDDDKKVKAVYMSGLYYDCGTLEEYIESFLC